MLMTVLGALRTAAVDRLDPRAVHVCIPDPGDGAERRAFGCPVHFGQPDMRLVFASRDLGRAPRVANRLVAREIEKLSAVLLAEVRSAASLQARMAESTRLLLATGVRPQRARVARRLGMSDRTLQRGLEREGTTFKRARDAIVREVVQALLLNPSIKIEEVARSIGFAEVGAFSKAFKRWTGCTPSAYREQIGPQTQDGGRASSAAGGPQEGEC